jgi:hypothetical protein
MDLAEGGGAARILQRWGHGSCRGAARVWVGERGGGRREDARWSSNAPLGFRDLVLFGGLVSSGKGGIWAVGCRSSDGSGVLSGVIRGLSVSVL